MIKECRLFVKQADRTGNRHRVAVKYDLPATTSFKKKAGLDRLQHAKMAG
jgi:hypothetical protein